MELASESLDGARIRSQGQGGKSRCEDYNKARAALRPSNTAWLWEGVSGRQRLPLQLRVKSNFFSLWRHWFHSCARWMRRSTKKWLQLNYCNFRDEYCNGVKEKVDNCAKISGWSEASTVRQIGGVDGKRRSSSNSAPCVFKLGYLNGKWSELSLFGVLSLAWWRQRRQSLLRSLNLSIIYRRGVLLPRGMNAVAVSLLERKKKHL